jgi:hypothetical protein
VISSPAHPSAPSQTANPQPPDRVAAPPTVAGSPLQTSVLPIGERPPTAPADTQRPPVSHLHPPVPTVTLTNTGTASAARLPQSDVPSSDGSAVQIPDRRNTIDCNLILPPDDWIVDETFDEKASVSDAIDRAQFHLQTMSILRICDGDSTVMTRDTLLIDLATPRDLFVQECVICEVGRRSYPDLVIERAEVAIDATLSDLQSCVSFETTLFRFSNRFGQIHPIETKVLDTDLFLLPFLQPQYD